MWFNAECGVRAQQPSKPFSVFGLRRALRSVGRQMGPFMSFIYIHRQPEGSTQLERGLVGTLARAGKGLAAIPSDEMRERESERGRDCQLQRTISH